MKRQLVMIMGLVVALSGCPPDDDSSVVPEVAASTDPEAWVSASAFTRRDENGRLLAIGALRHGDRHGLYRRFHANGQLAERGTYVGGLKHGSWEAWYANGALLCRSVYFQGTPVGEWTFYHPEPGRMLAQLSFEDGHLVGDFLVWDRDGRLASKTTFGPPAIR